MKIAIVLLMTSTLFACYRGSASPNVMVATHDLRTGVLIEESDVRIIAVSRTLLTPDIPRKRSEILGHKTIRPIQEGQLVHLSEVSH